MKIRKEKKIKGEIILKAIGGLPDEMVAWEDMEELKAGAERLEKQRGKAIILHGCTYAAIAALCAMVLVVSSDLLKQHNVPDVNSSYYVPDETQNTDSNINLFAAVFKKEDVNNTEDKNITEKSSSSGNAEKSYDNSNDSTDSNTGNINIRNQLKEFTEGSSFKLQVIQDRKENPGSISDKKAYIVFVADTDIYFNLSYKGGRTYILKEDGSKNYIKRNNKIYCNAGSQVYFDISGVEDKMYNVKDAMLPEWKSDGIDILAFVEIYLPEEEKSSEKEAGIFYIGRKNTNNEDLYYGMFKSGTVTGTDSPAFIKPEQTLYNKTVKSSIVNKNMAGKKKSDVFFYNNVPVYGKSEKNKIKKYLASLPGSITEKKAKEMGIVIKFYDYRKKNKFKDEWISFYKYVKKGEDACRPGNSALTCSASPYMAAVVVLKYTVEGDACYEYISFIDGEYYVYSDSSRDKYKASTWEGYSEIGTYKSLKKCKVEHKTLDKDKYLSIEYSLFKKNDITNKEANELFSQNNSYVNKYYNVFGYYK